ncbi:MAG: prepilin-type N-terminal cleavage/methylation domain-containing protein [Acholeplasmataceae bacterium]|nr:prepilin-type N-terminal cleavage/methylation domain-containing protein [Acholeplasmataceae bacterium]
MLRKHDGFSILELIVVIAILAVLASFAVFRFMSVNMSVRGSKIIADLNSCESAINIYYAKTGTFPSDINVLIPSYLAVWPTPPLGKALINKHDNVDILLDVQATNYAYVKPNSSSELDIRVGRVTLGGMTIEQILSTSETNLTLSDE